MAKYIKSPLNYIGGKYSILNDILAHFPENIDTFFDMFAGGLNVGINVNAKKIIANDHNKYIVEMFEYFKNNDIDLILELIDKRINEFELSKTNRDGYNALRTYYNNNMNPLDLFVLTCYSFNHQIRFNNKMQFNTPFGKDRSSYNESIKKNLIAFCDKLHVTKFELSSRDFRKIDFDSYGKNDVVYCDPPYLITTGSYNDGKRGFGDWTQKEDDDLLEILDKLNDKNITFFLSNVLVHKGMENEKLAKWANKYNVIFIDKKYNNCNYHLLDRESETVEVLVTNRNLKNEKK